MYRKAAAVLIGLLCSMLAGAASAAEQGIDAVVADHVKAVQARDLPELERTITSTYRFATRRCW